MSLKIRLARGGAKKRPYYRIVIADSRSPRDGRFIERIGSYNPLLPKGDEKRIVIDLEKAKEWLEKGATPTDRVARFLDAHGLMKRTERNNPKKAQPGTKAQERVAERAEKEEAKKTAAAAPAETPAEAAAEEAPAEEVKAEEAPAEDAKAEEAPAEEAPAEEAKAEEAPAEDAKAEEAPAEEAPAEEAAAEGETEEKA